MTPLFPAQRAAEEFDSVLEGRATTAVTERYAAMAATVQVLRDQPEALPRAAFVADLRERLMAAAETEMTPAAPVVRRLPSSSRRNRRLGTVAASLVIVGGSAGMAAASSGSLPGEALYPIKRGVEQVQLATHVGDASQGSALLGQAATRLDEVRQLVGSGSADPRLVDATVADFRSSANAGADKLFTAYQADADPADISAVRDFTSSTMEEVSSIAAGADPSSAGALRDTADAIADIDQQAATLCVTCGSPTALTPPAALAAGSGAASVTNLIARPVRQAGQDLSAQAEITQAQIRQLHSLQGAAQGAADKLATAAKSGDGAAARAPLTGTLTSAGTVVPSVIDATASTVTNLVTGVTTTVTKVTGGGGDGGNPVSTTVKGAGDAVGKTLQDVTGSVGSTVDGLAGSIAPKK